MVHPREAEPAAVCPGRPESPHSAGGRERPILFSGPMVRALLDGRKTQTRRIVKGLPEKLNDPAWIDQWHVNVLPPCAGQPHWTWWDGPPHGQSIQHLSRCPYGVPGDLLWVRETLQRDHPQGSWFYVADDAPLAHFAPFNGQRERHAWSHEKRGNTCVSIHMPRWASRLTLRITDVRVERLQDISEADALAEGAEPCANGFWFDHSPNLAGSDARGAYYCLWNHINGPGSWDANPWVWAVSFERVTP